MKKLRAGSSHVDPPLRIGQSASPAVQSGTHAAPTTAAEQAVIAAEADGLGRVPPGGAPAKEPAEAGAIGEAAAGASAAALRVAEEHAARLVEQPEWVLSEVLLSPDLAPHILAQLPTKEHAVKGTRGDAP
ncbi:hypothetical protein EMIHUDRAFT_237703 [Emiliania huxleyi CCMP1516]|uniref:Uncharacterized protein n=2 Tax=Emiliania huxleyi TaxID=2903 RepID=A0A0D3JPN7_EMIH1|nr:hypothetical protein EMIHUDRAFT_237703 [Emiliania huxleyi CCMP1516]EOD25472.1 hypothetical protein EMIHUDRAFT_237703 [Emiliania huxleyi CCMP1516]|eukprot:XP_005777901.1 hypothetical protein EMIHUDRAFT_237703 [Emiliania huxleyi CCMP1516]